MIQALNKNRSRRPVGVWPALLLILLLAAGDLPAAQTAQKEDLNTYKQSKRAIYRKDWTDAIKGLTDFETRFPGSKYSADAIYWLAYSLDKKGSRSKKTLQRINAKKEALARLDHLLNTYITSSWMQVAKVLRVKIAAELAASGLTKYMDIIMDGVNSDGAMETELKVVALDALLKVDMEKALPIFEEILTTGSNAELKKKSLFVLRSHSGPRIRALLEKVGTQTGSAPSSTAALSLPQILDNTARYCDKLENEVYQFSCYERVEASTKGALKYSRERAGLKSFIETEKKLVRDIDEDRWVPTNSEKRKTIREVENLLDQNLKGKKKYLNECRITMDRGRVKEQRVLLEYNGKRRPRKKADRQSLRNPFRSAVSPVFLFSKRNRQTYDYQLLGREKTMNRDAYVVAVLKKKNSAKKGTKKQARLAAAWIDADDFSILKIRVFPETFGGYNFLLKHKQRRVSNVKVTDIHYFGYKTKGIRLPTKTKVTLAYDTVYDVNFGTIVHVVSDTGFTYENYIFLDGPGGSPAP